MHIIRHNSLSILKIIFLGIMNIKCPPNTLGYISNLQIVFFWKIIQLKAYDDVNHPNTLLQIF